MSSGEAIELQKRLDSLQEEVLDAAEESVSPDEGGHVKVCRDELAELLSEFPDTDESIIPAMQEVQGEYGYLPPDALNFIAEKCKVSRSRVYGTATFYDQFYLEPRGDYTIKVCTGTACHVKGADELSEELQEQLDVGLDEVTDDGKFTIEHVRCVGACSLAPIVMVEDELYGHLSEDDVDGVIAEYE